MKLTKRKGFNFFRSYYDVYNELDDKDKVAFMDALLDREFLGIKPEGLKGMAKFAYISQTNSIDSQVKGYQDKTGIILESTTPSEGGAVGGKEPPARQVQVEVQEKEKEKDKYNTLLSRLDSHDFEDPTNFEIARMFQELFKRNLQDLGVNTKKIMEAKAGPWISQVRLMIEKDERTKTELREVYNFLEVDAFWKGNILSTAKLRKQFDKLLIKSRNEKHIANSKGSEGASTSQVTEILEKRFGPKG